MIRTARLALIAAAFATLASSASAELVLGSLFNDHMVLQRGHANPLWGTAVANAEVTVSFDGQVVDKTKADENGTFKLKLPARDASNDAHSILVRSGGDFVAIGDVLIGDVWIGSGQSNMQWTLANSADAEKEIADANHPNLRLYYVPRVGAVEPVKAVKAEWKVCTPDTAKGFSAVAYFFGRHLNRELNIPIGLIHSSWGGTPAEAWTPLPKLQALKDLPLVQKQLERRAAGLKGETLPPATQPMQPTNQNAPSSLYNGMIAPLADYGIKGVIWYQGETNAPRYAEYQKLVTTMIESWRDQFAQGDFPFYIVGLANFKPAVEDPNVLSEWANLREAQRHLGYDVKNAAMTVTIDIGNPENIHPTNKQEVGRRLALVALEDTYGQKLVSRGPVFQEAKFDGDKVTIEFEHVGGGLKAVGEHLESFALLGKDGKWAWADAKINEKGDEVIVSSPNVPTPVAVRYAWADNPKATLFNAEGLPAEPFEAKK